MSKIRFGLLAGSSLATALCLAPAAWAADECAPANPPTTMTDGVNGVSDPSLNGAVADSFACSTTPLANGISYSSDGDLTVTKTNTGATIIVAGGIDLVGNGSDSVTWVSTAGGITGGQTVSSPGPVGPLIDVVTDSGAINITTALVTANRAGTTHGIRAISGDALTLTAGGSITISMPSGSVNNNVAGGQAAILASTNGGNISITGGVQGRQRGILAETTGAGTISIASSASVSAIDGIAAIETIAGTGATAITLNNGTINGGAGLAIRSTSGAAVNVQNLRGTVSGRLDFSGVTAGGVVFNNTGTNENEGRWTASGASVFTSLADTVTLGDTGNSSLAAGGSIDFGGGGDTFNLAAVFTAATGTIDFGVGADTFSVTGRFAAEGTTVNFGADGDVLTASSTATIVLSGATLNFGAGTDVFNQSGVLFANGSTAIGGLEALNNTGPIYLGGGSFGVNGIDGVADDALSVSGVFTGSGASRIYFDANLGAHVSQLGCSIPTAADCVNFTSGTTAGSTVLNVRDVSFSVDGGTLNTVVTLVQGSTAAEHFTLDPASSYYTETPQGIAIRKPVVEYLFTYDAANQRHVLVGAPTDEVFQVGTFAASAQEAWRATTGSWLTRQADLRAAPGGLETSRGVWGKVGAQSGERDLAASYGLAGLTFDYNLSQKQKIAYMTLGADLVGGAGWIVGGMVGFVRSDVEFDAASTEAVTSGFNGGLYASYVAGPLFVDATVNANILHIKADAPTMGLGLDVPMKFDQKSLGGQVEAGWRFEAGSGLFVEPLAGVSYVVTRIDDTEVPGGSGLFEFEETKSLRIGGGARVGLDGELMGMAASYSLTGRYWNDSEGESGATIVTASGSSAAIMDDFGGGFSEVSGGLNLYSQDGGLSGFFNLGGKFGDGYQAVDGSVGVRVRW